MRKNSKMRRSVIRQILVQCRGYGKPILVAHELGLASDDKNGLFAHRRSFSQFAQPAHFCGTGQTQGIGPNLVFFLIDQLPKFAYEFFKERMVKNRFENAELNPIPKTV